MLDDLDQMQVLGLAVVAAAGLAFAGGYVLGDAGASTPTGNVVAAETVEDDVIEYLDVMTQGQADVSVNDVSEADFGGLYRVDVVASMQDPMSGETVEQEASLYTTLDGQYLFPMEPEDLQNPQAPQPVQPEVDPEDMEEMQEQME